MDTTPRVMGTAVRLGGDVAGHEGLEVHVAGGRPYRPHRWAPLHVWLPGHPWGVRTRVGGRGTMAGPPGPDGGALCRLLGCGGVGHRASSPSQ